jgi:hypothetical protein
MFICRSNYGRPHLAVMASPPMTPRPSIGTLQPSPSCARSRMLGTSPSCPPAARIRHGLMLRSAPMPKASTELSSMLNSIGKWSPSSVRTSFCNPETSLQTRHCVDLYESQRVPRSRGLCTGIGPCRQRRRLGCQRPSRRAGRAALPFFHRQARDLACRSSGMR